MKPPKVDPLAGSLLPPEVVSAWLRANRIPLSAIEDGRPVWPGADGKLHALTIPDVERLLSLDPDFPGAVVHWARLNFAERDQVREDSGEVWRAAGAPWELFPVQAEMAALRGNLIFQCGAEIGKTRDIVLGTLWEIDLGGANDLIAADSDITLDGIAQELDFQISRNARIGGGLLESRVKPLRRWEFANGSRLEMRLCGHDGRQFRGGHFGPTIRVDEGAKWKNPQQFTELWRAGSPGTSFRVYSTPDGDYSSPFFELCDRAEPINREKGSKPASATKTGPKFRKFVVTKKDLPAPFWTEERAAKFREMYGGEKSPGWASNVLGEWGEPSYSVFPITMLEPCLKYLPRYRVVAAEIDRTAGRVSFRAARLSPEAETLEGERREDLLADDRASFFEPRALANRIAEFFPSLADLTDPVLYCGADLGSATDPSEFLFARVVGGSWSTLFRLHLVRSSWQEQAEIVARLDHASGHRVRYGFDAGSAGSALISFLTESEAFRACPVCRAPVFFSERLRGFGFGEKVDETDEDGNPVLNQDRLDAGGNAAAFRLSNKEFSTRVLERKMQARELELGHDAGAGDQRLAVSQLLLNHTSSGLTSKGERRFRAEDDHFPDALRQLALRIVADRRATGPAFVAPDPALLVRTGEQSESRVFSSGRSELFEDVGASESFVRGIRSDWGA
jgi:hypothetical protein